MKIAVFGTGIVGQVIAKRLSDLNHDVSIGTRDPQNTLQRQQKDSMGNPPFAEWYAQNKQKVKLLPFSIAAENAEIIFNCTHGVVSVDALKLAGEKNIEGKILIDVANPLDFSKGMPPTLTLVNTDSLGELIQRTFPTLKVVKTLNTMVCFLMVNPAALPGEHNVFVSGNDVQAKSTAKEILRSFGWAEKSIIDLGDITTSRGTEQLLPIWVRLLGSLKSPMFNFSIVTAPSA
jgi:predicted dinucleotide-binding enzyme